MKPAIFLDRDGVLCEEVGHLHRTQDLKVIEGAEKALKMLRDLGYLLVLITNQGGIAKGLYSEKDFWNVTEELQRRLKIDLDGVYFCPHHPDGIVPDLKKECSSRKPAPGMILKAQKEMSIDLDKSWIIGDHLKDIIAGYNGKVWRRVLVLTGYGKATLKGYLTGEQGRDRKKSPHYVVQDILYAARFISLVNEKGDPIENALKNRSEILKKTRMI